MFTPHLLIKFLSTPEYRQVLLGRFDGLAPGGHASEGTHVGTQLIATHPAHHLASDGVLDGVFAGTQA
jgi:hypothetical protein